MEEAGQTRSAEFQAGEIRKFDKLLTKEILLCGLLREMKTGKGRVMQCVCERGSTGEGEQTSKPSCCSLVLEEGRNIQWGGHKNQAFGRRMTGGDEGEEQR